MVRSTPRVTPFLVVLISSMLSPSCSEEREEILTAVLVVVDPPSPENVQRIALRVWDTAGELTADHWLNVRAGDIALPWSIPLVPRLDADARWFRIEVDLFDAAGCPTMRGQLRNTYEPGVMRTVALELEPTGLAGCSVTYIDPNAAGAADTPESCRSLDTPCRTIRYALGQYRQSTRAQVFYIHGGATYSEIVSLDGGLRLDGGLNTGSAGTPLVLRAWPGTGLPRIDGGGTSDSTISLCCGPTAAEHVVLDGLNIVGGIRWGVSFNGANAADSVVRNSIIEGNGLALTPTTGVAPDARSTDSGVIFLNGARRNLIEHNIIRNNGEAGTASGQAVSVLADTEGDIVSNTIYGNRHDAIQVFAIEAPFVAERTVLIEGNVICDNGRWGVVVFRDMTEIRGNSIVGNAMGGAELTNAPRAVENLVALNLGVGISDTSSRATLENNWLHANVGGRDDGDPRLSEPDGCVLSLLNDSLALGTLPDGSNPGAF